MKLGDVLKKERERRSIPAAEMAEHLGLSSDAYEALESGNSPMEEYAPLILNFASKIQAPVSSLYYPCGIPFQELDDYPLIPVR